MGWSVCNVCDPVFTCSKAIDWSTRGQIWPTLVDELGSLNSLRLESILQCAWAVMNFHNVFVHIRLSQAISSQFHFFPHISGDVNFRFALPQLFLQSDASFASSDAVHVRGRPVGGRVQNRRQCRLRQILPRSQDRRRSRLVKTMIGLYNLPSNRYWTIVFRCRDVVFLTG